MAELRFVTKEDDSELKSLLSDNPMDSWVSISMAREPSYFDGTSLMGTTHTLISEEKSEIVGMYACSFFPTHFNGKSEKIGYLGSLRVSKPFRHKLRYLKEGFSAIDTTVPKEQTVPCYFTSIASENSQARRLLEANLKGMPTYTPIGQMSTLIFSSKQTRVECSLQQATKDDIPKIVAFYNQYASAYHLSPHLSETWMMGLNDTIGLKIEDFYMLKDHHGTLQCCLALWDQRAFKQSVIYGYRTPLKQIRQVYNIYARLSNRVELPATGKALEHLFIAFFAYKDENVVIKVIKTASNIARNTKNVSSCILGLSSQHVLLPLLKQKLNPSIYLTEIESVLLYGEKVDTVCFDDRLVQPEVALL